jgi:hypothetical protein
VNFLLGGFVEFIAKAKVEMAIDAKEWIRSPFSLFISPPHLESQLQDQLRQPKTKNTIQAASQRINKK